MSCKICGKYEVNAGAMMPEILCYSCVSDLRELLQAHRETKAEERREQLRNDAVEILLKVSTDGAKEIREKAAWWARQWEAAK